MTAKTRRARLHLGDVFTVPIDADRVGFGQVVGTYGKDAYYFAIYDAVVSDADDSDPTVTRSSEVVGLRSRLPRAGAGSRA